MTKDKPREAAIRQTMEDAYNARCRRMGGLGNWNEYTDGYRDGYDAATAWTKIESVEDLPKETGRYEVTMHTPSTEEHVTILPFYKHWLHDPEHRQLKRDWWLKSKTGTQWAIAWRPLPAPYVEQGGNEKIEDAT